MPGSSEEDGPRQIVSRPSQRHSTRPVSVSRCLIRAIGGRFVEPGQPWLRTDDRGITWLDAEVTGRYADAVSSGERHILALVEALALGKPLEDVGGLMASVVSIRPRYVGDCAAAGWTALGAGRRAAVDGLCVVPIAFALVRDPNRDVAADVAEP
jgi:hypothetical protein